MKAIPHKPLRGPGPFRRTFDRVRRFGDRHFTVMLVPHSERRVFSFQISNWGLFFLGALLAVSFSSALITARDRKSLAAELGRIRESDRQWREESDRAASLLREQNGWVRTQTEENAALLKSFGANDRTLPVPGRAALERAAYRRLEKSYGIPEDSVSASLLELAVLRERIENARGGVEGASRVFSARKLFSRDIPSRWPIVDGSGFRSSGFGPRYSPFDAEKRFHTGLDVASMPGNAIAAAADGTVLFSGLQAGYGWMIMIQHAYGWITLYGHNQRNLVYEGQRVKRGERIALLGQSGRATGPHVHFEIRLAGQPVDPLPYLQADF